MRRTIVYFVPLRMPVMVESYETFTAPNPWSPNPQPVQWTLGGMRWGSKKPQDPARTQAARAKSVRPRGIWVGIQSNEARVARILPDGLQELYWQGLLPARDIPRLLHELAPEPLQGGSVVIRGKGWEQVDTKAPRVTTGDAIFTLVWLLAAVFSVTAIWTGFMRAVHETGAVAWVGLAIFVGIPAWLAGNALSERTLAKTRRTRALEILNRSAGPGPAAGGPAMQDYRNA